MKSALTILIEQFRSIYLIQRLALYEMKIDNSGNYLGVLWEIINPMIQIAIYWFVFGYGITHSAVAKAHASRHVIENIPYFPWLLAGISVWFFVNQSIILGSKSIYTRIGFISKMSFPMSAIPSFIIMSKFYQHLVLLFIIMIILSFSGYPPNIYYLQLPYYMVGTLFFLLSISLITSTLSTIVRDVHMILAAIMRMMIYLSPFLWMPSGSKIQFIMKLNPLYYIAEGYRQSLVGNHWYFIEHLQYTIYFWVLLVILFVIGSLLHLKFRSRFVDYL